MAIITMTFALNALCIDLVDIYNMRPDHDQQMQHCMIASINYPRVFMFDDHYLSYIHTEKQKRIIDIFLSKKIIG